MIRRAKLTDVPKIVEIENLSFPSPWNEQQFMDVIDDKNKLVIVKDTSSSIEGYIVLEKVLDEASITDMAVAPASRKKGIATELIGAVIEVAKNDNIEKLFLEVRSTNRDAIKLYERYGFVRTGVRKGYYSCNCENADLYELKLK